ncbi:MAG TPA: L-rhamnose/proton symporter RhaT [Terracidiphilus sp.]|jgi:L-rhamnose-H+ transport protein|nr:L-rhamnose/proton symporter RhaT [Terracidiphilus sp.]
MSSMVLAGALLAILSGLMNGAFTLPMRFLGKWEWENVWSLFIVFACLAMPSAILALIAPQSWSVIATAPSRSIGVAVVAGFAWGFGAILFGQSVSAIGISLANTLVLAISSALGALLPMLFLTPENLFRSAGQKILGAVAVEVAGIALCGWAGRLREKSAGIEAERGEMVGRARPVGVALLMAAGSGVLSAVFNTGFALAQPIAAQGRAAGMSQFSSTNLIWWLMLASGSVANLAFCFYLFGKNRSLKKFAQPGASRLCALCAIMALLWGGSIFVYGASVPRLGSLGTSIGWPLSLAVGLLLANAIGMRLGEWKQAPRRARIWMYSGVAVLVVAVVLLSRASS